MTYSSFDEPSVTLVEVFTDAYINSPGGASSSDIKYNFSFGDASPATILVANNNDFIRTVTVNVTTVFDGANPTISIGDSGSFDRLFPASSIDLKDGTVEWEYNPNYRYTATTNVLLTINPDGATQGSGTIYIEKG
jgi:hypothetical protein